MDIFSEPNIQSSTLPSCRFWFEINSRASFSKCFSIAPKMTTGYVNRRRRIMNDQSSRWALAWVPTGIVTMHETRLFLGKFEEDIERPVYVSIFAKPTIGTEKSFACTYFIDFVIGATRFGCKLFGYWKHVFPSSKSHVVQTLSKLGMCQHRQLSDCFGHQPPTFFWQPWVWNGTRVE